MIKRLSTLIWLLFFGSLWGLSEVVVGEALYEADIPRASVWLSVWGIFILASCRGLINKPGTSVVVGGIAAIFRLVNTAFACHFFGVFLIGAAFDLAASCLMKKGSQAGWRGGLTGLLSAYGGNALFALIFTTIIRDEFWVKGGLPKVFDHVLVSGSFLAILSSFLVPVGFRLGLKARALLDNQPRWAYSSLVVFIFLFWTLGRLAG